jgi:hypothetical protein
MNQKRLLRLEKNKLPRIYDTFLYYVDGDNGSHKIYRIESNGILECYLSQTDLDTLEVKSALLKEIIK